MLRLAGAVFFLILAACAGVPAQAGGETSAPACAPAAQFAGLESREAAISAMPEAARVALAMDMIACLENPDPAIRDGFAYEAYVTLMRGKLVDVAAVKTLQAALLAKLADADGDPGGFRGPFAALVLAETARVDRLKSYMTPEERDALIAAAAAYLSGLTDYRGFSDAEGWRHGVAHTADLLMQLSLNPELTKPQAEAILAAVALKVAPSDHAYVFGEGGRLAHPVLYLAQRRFLTDEEWADWFAGLWPAEDPLWRDVYGSEAALAKLHNLRAFSDAVYISATAGDDERLGGVAAAAFATLSGLP